MGMDVIGLEPQSEQGHYFRANVWSWHPIWDYCETISDVAAKVKNAHSNDGDGLNGEDATQLGLDIISSVKGGLLNYYLERRKEYVDSLPPTPCIHCGATGVRVWYEHEIDGTTRSKFSYDISVEDGTLPSYVVKEKFSDEIEVSRDCNGCDGVGSTKAWLTQYNFEEPHLLEFANFCLASGGFEIH